jgi:hypothetical protein
MSWQPHADPLRLPLGFREVRRISVELLPDGQTRVVDQSADEMRAHVGNVGVFVIPTDRIGPDDAP